MLGNVNLIYEVACCDANDLLKNNVDAGPLLLIQFCVDIWVEKKVCVPFQSTFVARLIFVWSNIWHIAHRTLATDLEKIAVKEISY